MRLVTWRVNILGSRTWACMKLIFDDLFLVLDLKFNLIRIGNPIQLLLEKTILWSIFYKPLIENGYCACMPKICLFLLIEVWPGNHLISLIFLASNEKMVILHAWHFSFLSSYPSWIEPSRLAINWLSSKLPHVFLFLATFSEITNACQISETVSFWPKRSRFKWLPLFARDDFYSCNFLWNHKCLSNQRTGLVLAQTITFQMIRLFARDDRIIKQDCLEIICNLPFSYLRG